MNKKSRYSLILISLIILLIIIIGLVLFSLKLNESKDKTQICFQENCIIAEVAKTSEERTKGLMFREDLSEDQGMLFIFDEEGSYSFWMKNTYIPLDLIWIDQNNTIVDIKSAQPCKEEPCPSYKPKASAKYVVEVNQGFAEQNNINIGDKVSIS